MQSASCRFAARFASKQGYPLERNEFSSTRSAQDFVDDSGGFDAGQTLVEALEGECETFVVDAELV
jgi:hypothetical protein